MPSTPDQSGPKYFISVIEDISERSAAEQALQESERFRRLVESKILVLPSATSAANHLRQRLFPEDGGI